MFSYEQKEAERLLSHSRFRCLWLGKERLVTVCTLCEPMFKIVTCNSRAMQSEKGVT